MQEGGGNEIWRLEYLKVALGGMVALGAVDDGLAAGRSSSEPTSSRQRLEPEPRNPIFHKDFREAV